MEECHRQAAYDLGTALAKSGIAVVFGGINKGLMKIVADAALAAGGKVIGVVPEDMDAELRYPPHPNYEQILVPDVEERMKTMRRFSDGGIIMPGGWGADEEKAGEIRAKKVAMKTAKRRGVETELSKRPIILFDPNGFEIYSIKKLERLARAKGDDRDLRYFKVAETIGEVFGFLGIADASTLKENPYYHYPIVQNMGRWLGNLPGKRYHHKDRPVGAPTMVEHFKFGQWHLAATLACADLAALAIKLANPHGFALHLGPVSVSGSPSFAGVAALGVFAFSIAANALTGKNVSTVLTGDEQPKFIQSPKRTLEFNPFNQGLKNTR